MFHLTRRIALPFMLLFIGAAHLLSASPVLVVGIAGGTGSGKTTFAESIQEKLGEEVSLISQDSYYRELTHLSMADRAQTNFDHPDSIDFELLREQIVQLQNGQAIEKPIYNFSTYSREETTETVSPTRVILVEGILIFSVPELRELLDIKVFIDTDADIRLLRRIERDINERGRTFPGVQKQYLATVRPMHDVFVEPSKQYADIIVPGGGKNPVARDLVLARLLARHPGL